MIKSATDADGQPGATWSTGSRAGSISAKTSAKVRDLMQAVIDSPNGQRNLKLDDYQTGGKTGTAQRADTKCHCYKGYVTSFVGFAPLDDPQILTYVVISNPRQGRHRHRRSPRRSTSDIMNMRAAALLRRPERQGAQAAADDVVRAVAVRRRDIAPGVARIDSIASLPCLLRRGVCASAAYPTARQPDGAAGRRRRRPPVADCSVSGITLDSRLVSPGDLYVALPGPPAPRCRLRRRGRRAPAPWRC